MFPSKVSFRSPSESRSKSSSAAGKPILEHAFKLYWLSEHSEPALAPNAKIIDYFQYPKMLGKNVALSLHSGVRLTSPKTQITPHFARDYEWVVRDSYPRPGD